jgi:hypothetical protein
MPHHNFVDGFHTAYNLEALKEIHDLYPSEELMESISKGYQYYSNTFVRSDGSVKYYSHSLYPEDTHNNAQALITLIKFDNKTELYNCVAEYMINKMYNDGKGNFIYQRYKSYKNNINYIRWSQGWAFYSLTSYLLFSKK